MQHTPTTEPSKAEEANETKKEPPVTFRDIIAKFQGESLSERQKGADFEKLMQRWLKTVKVYSELFSNVWLWEEFPARADFGGKDIGIDIVAKTDAGEYWAVQCKCYGEDSVINKEAIDSFIAASSKRFNPEGGGDAVGFVHRLWISTTDKGWTREAEHEIENQNPPFTRISLTELENSPVDWQKLLDSVEGKGALKEPKRLLRHQKATLEKAVDYYVTRGKTRGKLVMACGTGKTFTSLKIAEKLVELDGKGRGLVLFMVPSIALLGQALNDWFADASVPMKAVCVCSDPKSSRMTSRGAKSDDADESMSVVDLALPATTSKAAIAKRLLAYQESEGLVVVFSTYQSVQAVMEAQRQVLSDTEGKWGVFDLVICDEAHRTTGAHLKDNDESEFTKIHYDENVRAARRLYMTATPRIYGDSAKSRAKEKDYILCSMDDETIYGEEFYRVPFSYAVRNGILTDYRVVVLAQSEDSIPASIEADITDPEQKGIDYNIAGKLIGVINGLSKRFSTEGDQKIIETDPGMMKRAIAFARVIGKEDMPGSSKNIARVLPAICTKYSKSLSEEQRQKIVKVEADHVDGSMGAVERNQKLSWLAADTEAGSCRVICNVRCLSEGVDVPALDAVLFLAPKNSQVDVVQSVGRVMRSFKKGTPDEKKYGYIIIPVVVPQGKTAEEALNDNKSYAAVWQILNALRAHDDHFDAIVNTIALNEDSGGGGGTSGSRSGKGRGGESEGDPQGKIIFEGVTGYVPKLVEKCGERMYWENWAGDIGIKAASFIERIRRLVKDSSSQYAEPFDEFVRSLKAILNPAVTEDECIEMLSQHVITRPIFEALFEGYKFLRDNPVSLSMQKMLDVLLASNMFSKDMEQFNVFFESVQANVKGITTLSGKQTVIKNLYERFFKIAFPKTTQKLGIVYTPVECVDFMLQSVDDILRRDFGVTLASENVHILDPFVGTGTFICRLLQSGLIETGDVMRRKYENEIHANEINLLAYYVASVNIEAVFHEINGQSQYTPFGGICLTDTFQTTEDGTNDKNGELFAEYFAEESEILKKQQSTSIRVIIGNPPYSVGQRSANDNAQNDHYPKLEGRIDATYAKLSTANLKKALYDSYIKAFRWASDRLDKEKGGVIAFISNGSWIDGNAHDGMRAALVQEFDKIYVFNLRGNARTSGELRRRERDNVFGQGTRTPVSITLLVKLAGGGVPKGQIFYHDIGDYLSREQKMAIITRSGSIRGLEWQRITPNEKHDWINPRGGEFESLIPIGDKDDKSNKQTFFEPVYSNGVVTSRDAWAYNSSKKVLARNIKASIEFYNSEVDRCLAEAKNNPGKKPAEFINFDSTKFKWDRVQKESDLPKGRKYEFSRESLRTTIYRPFFKQFGYFNRDLNNCVYQMPSLFPTAEHSNRVICTSGVGVTKEFSCIITDTLPDLELIGKSQCFPLYWYEEVQDVPPSLFEAGKKYFVRHYAVTDWLMSQIKQRFHGAENLSRETVFYYVYGLLHSPDYRRTFAADLKKSLPRLPIAESAADFNAFAEAGRRLAKLHLGYDKELGAAEQRASSLGVRVVCEGQAPAQDDEAAWDYWRVSQMRFAKLAEAQGAGGKTADKSRIVYNSRTTVEGVPPEAYEYVVNGKSAVEWVMERYAVTTDKRSGITNDANDLSREVGKPRYVLDVLLSVICLSVETQRIVESLPQLKVVPAS